MEDGRVDIVVIGGGPGGYVAAIRAAQLGGQVVLIEKDSLGGTCMNRGCIPTKALSSSIDVLRHCQQAAQFGVEVGTVAPNLAQMVARKDKVVAQLVKGVDYLLRSNNVRVVGGLASIVKPGLVEIRTKTRETERIEARAIVIATGSEPATLPALPFDGQSILDSTDALGLTEIPESLAVVGAGAIGLEFAKIFSALGSQVTIVEMLPQVLPTEDSEIATILDRELRKRRIRVMTKTTIERMVKGETVKLHLSNGETLDVRKVLVAVGRSLNTAGIGLENIALSLEQRRIPVNEQMETATPGVYAVGDVVGGPFLAHVASRQGMVAVENILGRPTKMDYRVVPRTVWTSPEVASVGLNEQQALAAGYTVKVAKFPFRGLGKAVAKGETDGLVKVVGDMSTGELLGCQMIGSGATDLIAEAAMAIALETTVEDLARTIHAHPTMPEALMECAHAWVNGRAINV